MELGGTEISDYNHNLLSLAPDKQKKNPTLNFPVIEMSLLTQRTSVNPFVLD